MTAVMRAGHEMRKGDFLGPVGAPRPVPDRACPLESKSSGREVQKSSGQGACALWDTAR